jgi:hypothetical protein
MNHLPLETIAGLLLATAEEITALTRAGRLPAPSEAGYPLVPTVQAYIRHLRGTAPDAQRARLAAAKAEAQELQNRKHAGEMLDLATVRGLLEATIDLVKREVTQHGGQTTDQILAAIAAGLPHIWSPQRPGGAPDPAAEQTQEHPGAPTD